MPKWTFERWVALLNLGVLLLGSGLAAFEWYPKFVSETNAARASSQTPTTPTSDLKADDLGTAAGGDHIYEVTDEVGVKNASTSALPITYSVTLLFVGQIRTPVLPPHGVSKLNSPPNPWDASGAGDIDWKLIDYDASWIDGKVPDKVKRFFASPGHNYRNLSPGQGLTGVVAPGDSTGDRPDFIVRAHPGEFVAIVEAYGIGDATTSPSPKINLVSDFLRLGD